MHGGANAQYPAMHGGGVGPPCGASMARLANVELAVGRGGPTVDHGGLQPRPTSWRGTPCHFKTGGRPGHSPHPSPDPAHPPPRRRARVQPVQSPRSRPPLPARSARGRPQPPHTRRARGEVIWFGFGFLFYLGYETWASRNRSRGEARRKLVQTKKISWNFTSLLY